MGRLKDRVAIVTGAGRGLGRAHALELASHGAKVVINDVGAGLHGDSEGSSPADDVVAEIRDAGGEAGASGHDVANWQQAQELVQLAIDTFGDLHVLVNNAGILRDRTFANMSEEEWDDVIRVHLKGHAATSKHALAYWRDRAKAGYDVNASVIGTASTSGYAPNFGQANYGAAKLGIVGLSGVIALEGVKYGVRANVVAPSARTRMTHGLRAEAGTEFVEPPFDPEVFNPIHPRNVSSLVAWLSAPDCRATGQLFHIGGGRLSVLSLPPVTLRINLERRWTLDDFDSLIADTLTPMHDINDLCGS